MTSWSIVRFGDFLLVTVQTYLDDDGAVDMAERLGTSVVRHSSKGILIDISAVDVVDSFMARTLEMMVSSCRLLGATTIVVGMRPEVAITLVELGVAWSGVRTALNVDAGIALLRRLNSGPHNG